MSSNETTVSSSLPETSTSEESIYHIYRPEVIPVNNGSAIFEKRKRLFWFKGQSIEAVAPESYNRHNNLDTQKLTFLERFRLFRLHYFRKVRLFRLAFVACCIALFFITTTKVFEKFFNHVTVVNIEYKLPTSTTLPGITLCVHLSQGVNYENVLVDDVINGTKERGRFHRIAMKDVITDCKFYKSTIEYETPEIFDCEKIVPVLVSLQYGHKCFTFFSNIHDNWNSLPENLTRRYQFEFDLFPRIELSISDKLLPKSNSSKYQNLFRNMKEANNTLVYVMIHSPTILPFMQETGTHFVVSQHTTNIWFQVQIEKLLESQYTAACYSKYGFYDDPPPNVAFEKPESPIDRMQYRSHGECVMYCLWRRMNKKCVNFYSIFTTDMVKLFEEFSSKKTRFCSNHNGVAEYWNQVGKCMEFCPPPCTRLTFPIGRTFSEKSTKTKIIVEWRNEPVYVISHHAATSLESFIGNVGGHAHVWLGFSVVRVFDFIANSIRTRQFILGYCCLFHWFRWFRS